MKRLLLLTFFMLILSQQGFSQRNNIPKKATKLYQQANLHYTFLRTEQAVETLKKAIKAHPKYIEAVALLARIETDQKNYVNAIKQYEKLIELSPKDVCKANFQIGKVYMKMEEFGEASKYLSEVAGNESCQGSTRVNAGKILQISQFRQQLMNSPVAFNPQPFDSLINSGFHDYLPVLTADNEHLFFTRRLGEPPLYNEDFYEANKDEYGNWQLAIDMGEPINTTFNEGALTISPDGKRLFFAAVDRFGGEGNFDLWYSYKKGGKWIKPLSLGRPINTPLWESQPSISADGKELFFAAKNGKGRGGIDIWVSTLENNIWQEPINVSELINTEKDDQCPYIHPDGKTLYFSSNGHMGMGSSDLFVVKRNAKGEWGKPVNLGYPINTQENENSLFVSADGELGYYSQYINGNFDLVSFELPDYAKPSAVTYVKGTVASADENMFLPAKIEIYKQGSGELIAITETSVKQPDFLLTLPIGEDYIFNVESEGFLPHSEQFSLAEAELLENYQLEILLNRIPILASIEAPEIKAEERKIVMKNILFETSSAELKKASFIELNKIVTLLNESPNMKMLIEGHTDNVGSDLVNLQLSKDRAAAVKTFLVENGIAYNRLTTNGKGETEPIDTNETTQGKANNRRTEFVILN